MAFLEQALPSRKAIPKATAANPFPTQVPHIVVVMPIFELSMRASGKSIHVRTPFQLREKECEAIQPWLNEDVECVGRRDGEKVFDGRDILQLARFLRGSRRGPWRDSWHEIVNDCDVRHQLVVEVDDVRAAKGLSAVKEFGYEAAMARRVP